MYFCDARSQGVGIDSASPNTKLDVNGDLALRIGSYTASNGSNNNISIGAMSFIRISGPLLMRQQILFLPALELLLP